MKKNHFNKISFLLLAFGFHLSLSGAFASQPLELGDGKWIHWEEGSEEGFGDLFYEENGQKKLISGGVHENDVLILPSEKGFIYIGAYGFNFFLYDLEQDRIFDLNPHHSPDPRIEVGFSQIKPNPGKEYFAVHQSSTQRENFLIFDVEKLEKFIASFQGPPNSNGITVLGDNLGLSEFGTYKDGSFFLGTQEWMIFLDNFEWKVGTEFTFQSTSQQSSLIQEEYQGDFIGGKAEIIGYYPPSPFSDLKENDPDYAEVLRAMKDGWLQGYSDGTIRLDQPINRAEFSKVAIQALGIPQSEPSAGADVCPDAPAGQWYSAPLHTAKQKGAIQGYPQDGLPKDQWPCKPGQTINKVEGLKVLLELAGFHTGLLLPEDYANQFADTKDETAWFAPYTAYSKIEALIRPLSDGRLLPGDPMTRREMVYLANHMIDVLGKWSNEF